MFILHHISIRMSILFYQGNLSGVYIPLLKHGGFNTEEFDKTLMGDMHITRLYSEMPLLKFTY